MSKVPHQPAADNYIALLRVSRLREEVELIVATAEELVTPGDELTVVHLGGNSIHGCCFCWSPARPSV